MPWGGVGEILHHPYPTKFHNNSLSSFLVFLVFFFKFFLATDISAHGRNLGERERTILYLRFFKGKTQVEVADEIGISQAQVSRLEKGVISRIKDSF